MDDWLRRAGIYFGLLDGPELERQMGPRALGPVLLKVLCGAVVVDVVAGGISTLVEGQDLTIGGVAHRGGWWTFIAFVTWLPALWREQRGARADRSGRSS